MDYVFFIRYRTQKFIFKLSRMWAYFNFSEALSMLCLTNRFRGSVTSVSDPYSSNPDPAKNLNPDPGRP